MDLFRLFIIQLLVSVLLCNSILAQEKSVADSLRLPEVVVTEKITNRNMRSTTPEQYLNDKTIQNLNSLQLSDAVKHFSGVTVKDYGGIGGLKTISVRSLGSNHTNIIYNGIALNDVQTGQIDIGRYSIDNISSITLNIGQSDQIFLPAKALSGASILSINTQSPKFDDNSKFNGKLSVKGGSFGLLNPTLSTNIKISKMLSASFSSELMSAHGRYPFILQYGQSGVDSSSLETRKNSDVKNLRLETSLFANFSKKTKGDIRLYYYESERGLPGATIFYNTVNFSSQRLWDKTFFIQSHIEHTLSSKWKLQANAKYNKGYLKYLDPSYLGADGKIEDIFHQDEIYGSLAALYRAFNRLSFSLASDVTSATMNSNRPNFATPNRITSHSSLSARWISEQLFVTASLLHTQTFESVKTGNPADNRSKLSPHLSLSFKPYIDNDFRLRAFYKNSFRLPTFNDLYYPLVGLRNLQPEDAHQYNFGVTHSRSINEIIPSLQLSVDAYHNRVYNKIIAYPSGNLHQWTMMNLGKVHINGIDVSTESAIVISENRKLHIGTSYTYQKALDKTNKDKNTYNHQIPYSPVHSGSIRSLIDLSFIDISYTLIWSGKRYSNSYNSKEFMLNGYSDHALSVSKEISTKFGLIDLSIEALNLANKNYEIVRNYPMPGRSFRGHITLNF